MISNEVVLMKRWLEESMSVSAVARRLGRSRQTVYNWKRKGDAAAEPKPRASKLDPHRSYIESRLEKYDLPATARLRSPGEGS